MEGNVVQGHTRLVVLGVQKICEGSRGFGRRGQSKSNKLHPRRDLQHCLGYRIIAFYVMLRRGVVFSVDLVEDFPVADVVMMAGGVEFSQFVGEAPLCVPACQSCIVVSQRPQIVEFRALRIVPENLIRIVRIQDWLGRREHPLGDCAEAEDRAVTLRSMQEVLDNRVDVLEVPEGLVGVRRAQLRNGQLWVRIPEGITNIISPQLVESLEGGIVNGRSTAQHRIDNCLQGGDGTVGCFLLPHHNHRGCTRRALRGQETTPDHREQREDHNDSIAFCFHMLALTSKIARAC